MKSNFAVLASLCAVTLSIGCSSSTKDTTPVGTVPAGAFTFEISQEGAPVAAGATSRFVLKATAGGKPASVTGWIGVASGEGSTKKDAVYDANDGDFDDDVVAPSPLPAGAMFWFTVTDGAASTTASIAWKK